MIISLANLYDWNSNLFKDFKLPTAPTPLYEGQYVDNIPAVNKEYIIDNLLFETYEQEVIIADPVAMQKLIALWSKRHVDRWQKIYNTFWYKYNPIWNKDGLIVETATETRDLAGSRNTQGSGTSSGNETETRNLAGTVDETDTETRNLTGSKNTQGSGTSSGTETSETDSTASGTATSIDSVAGFNEANTLTQNKKNELTHSDTTHNEGSITRSGTTGNTEAINTIDTGTVTTGKDVDTTETGTIGTQYNGQTSDTEAVGTTDTGTIEHERRRVETGNIGVTATQELIERERAINSVSIYDIIIAEFKKQFILSVY